MARPRDHAHHRFLRAAPLPSVSYHVSIPIFMHKQHQERIAIIGSRGIPAEFGGFETFAEQLALRLVHLGWDVTVFCESNQNYRKPQYKGVNLKYIYAPRITAVRSIWFDLLSVVATLRGYDIVYMLGYHAGFVFVLPRLFATNFWVNMDGLEWRRTKWSLATRRYLKAMESLTLRLAPHIVADAQGIADHLTANYPRAANKTHVVEYGASLITREPKIGHITDNGLIPRGYYLVVCRLEPENHVREIVEGFIRSDSRRFLIIVGDHATGTAYVSSLLKAANDRVIFFGSLYDQEMLTALRFHCLAYIHGHSVGGTNPSLLESMACGTYIIAHDNVFNREVTAGLCAYFTNAADLERVVRRIDKNGPPCNVGAALINRVESHYNWDRIADVYRVLFEASVSNRQVAQNRF
ncbi:MAG: DUF1972 domain-containing protein [Caldilineaceae bacterium]